MTDPMPPPFLRLPVEIRLQIFSLLLHPQQVADLLPSSSKVCFSTQDYHDYGNEQRDSYSYVTNNLSHPTLCFRTIDPTRYKDRYAQGHARSIYSVRADRFRARCMATTYHCVNVPRIGDGLAVLRCCKQTHAEAAELLYSSYTFDFDTHIEALAPFLSDLTPLARSCVKNLRIVKRALPYLKDFDRCEWHNALRLVALPTTGVRLRRLELGIVAGRPGENGWASVHPYTSGDFETLQNADGMEWMHDLLELTGLRELEVEAIIEHSPPCGSSTAMANYVRFSASVSTGFAQFLKRRLLKSGAVMPTSS